MLKDIKKSTLARIYQKENGYIEEKDMSSWISRVQILIYLVSFLDSLIIAVALWYILNSLQVSSFICFAVGIISFVIVFPTIMIIDISITTFDTSNFLDTTTEKIEQHKEPSTSERAFRKIKKINYAFIAAIFFRLIIYLIIFLVSFKSLQFVLNELLKEVNRKELSKLNIDSKQEQDKKILSLKDEIKSVSEKMYKEVSGTGETKIRGIGGAFKTLEKRKIELETELDNLINNKKNINIDSLSALPNEELIKKFPQYKFIEPPKVSFPFFSYFFGKKEMYFHELIAGVLSLILFLSIIILKITGGTRINNIYYNSALQDLFNDYVNLNLHEKHIKEIRDYSDKLDKAYKPSAESFYRWFTNQYPVTERELIMDTFQRVQDEKTVYLDTLINIVEKKKDEKSISYELHLNDLNTSEDTYSRLSEELTLKEILLLDLKNNIESIDNAIKTPVDDQYIINLTKSQVFQKTQYKNTQDETSLIKTEINTINNKKISQNEKKQIIQKLKENDENLYTSLNLLKTRLTLLFVKQKLKLNYQETELKNYSEWINEVIDFIDKLIDKFFHD